MSCENNLLELSELYTFLYSSVACIALTVGADKPDVDVFFNLSNISSLSDKDQALCDGLITGNEALKA